MVFHVHQHRSCIYSHRQLKFRLKAKLLHNRHDVISYTISHFITNNLKSQSQRKNINISTFATKDDNSNSKNFKDGSSSDSDSELDEFEIGGQGSRRRRKSRKSKKQQQENKQQSNQQQKLSQDDQNQSNVKKKMNISMFDIDSDDFGSSSFLSGEEIQDDESQQQTRQTQQQQKQIIFNENQQQTEEDIFESIDLETQLQDSRTYKSLEEIVDSYGDNFSFRNAVAILSELAWIVSRSNDPVEIKKCQKSPEILKMTKIIFEDVNNIRGCDTAIIFWSLVRLNYLPDNYFKILNDRIELDAENFEARYLSIVLYSYAKIKKFPENRQIIWQLYKQVQVKLPDLEPQGISNVIWAFARLGHANKSLIISVVQRSEQVIQKFEPMGLGIVIWSIATLKIPVSSNYLQQICEVSTKKLKDFSEQGISMLIWGLSKLKYFDDYLLANVGYMIKTQEFLFNPVDLNTLCCGFALQKYWDVEVWQILEKQTRVFFYNGDLGLEEIAGLLWSFASVTYYPQDLLEDGLIASLGEKLQFCGPQELQNIMWSLVKLRIPITSETVQLLVRCALRNVDKMNPSMISTIASALSTMEDSKQKQKLARQLIKSARFIDFTPQEFSNMILACSKMNVPLFPYEKYMERFLFYNIKKLKPADFAMVFFSMGRNKEFYFSTDFMGLFMWHASTWMPKMSPQHVCYVVFGCAGRNFQIHKTLLMTIGLHITSRVEEYKIGDVAMVLFNLGRLEQSPGALALKMLDERAAKLFRKAKPKDIASISKGFAMLSYYPQRFVIKLEDQWQEDSSKFELRESEAIQISLKKFNQLTAQL